MQKLKIHYAWVVAVGCSLTMFYGAGLLINSLGLFFPSIIEEYGYTKAQMSATISWIYLSSIVVMFLVGRFAPKANIRNTVFIFSLFMVAGFIMFSKARTLGQFYFASVLAGIGFGGGTTVPATILITRWFDKKSGLALGMTFSGTAIGSMIFAPITSKIIYTYSFQDAFMFQAIAIFILAIITFTLIRNNPEDLKIKPYGYSVNRLEEKKVETGISFVKAVRTPSFYGLLLTIFLIGVTLVATNTLVPSFLIEAGYTPEFAAMIVSLFSGALILGQILYGEINDRFGTSLGNKYIFFCWLLALGILFLVPTYTFTPYLFAIFSGLGNPIGTITLPVWTIDLFGQKDYGILYAAVKAAFSVGSILGTPLAGLLADKYGSYLWAIGIYILAIIMAFGLIQFAYRLQYQEQKVIKGKLVKLTS